MSSNKAKRKTLTVLPGNTGLQAAKPKGKKSVYDPGRLTKPLHAPKWPHRHYYVTEACRRLIDEEYKRANGYYPNENKGGYKRVSQVVTLGGIVAKAIELHCKSGMKLRPRDKGPKTYIDIALEPSVEKLLKAEAKAQEQTMVLVLENCVALHCKGK